MNDSKAEKSPNAPLIISGMVGIVGMIVWIMDFVGLTGGTGMNNITSWGSYLMLFIFFIGLGAGSMLLVSFGTVFGIKTFEPYVKIGTLFGIVFVAVGGLLVMLDLGNPLNIMAMLIGLNIGSALAWDMICITAFLVITIVLFVSMMKNAKAKNTAKASRGLAIAALLAAFLLLCVDALLFQVQASRTSWHTALLIPWFFASALSSGSALLLLTGCLLEKNSDAKTGYQTPTMAKFLLGFICLDLFMLTCDVLFGLSSSNSSEALISQAMLSGGLAPFFWVQVALCVVAIVLIAKPGLKAASSYLLSCVFALAAVFVKRIDFMLGGFYIPNINLPSAEGMTNYAFIGAQYVPSWSEIVVCIGAIGIALFLVFWAFDRLPIKTAE